MATLTRSPHLDSATDPVEDFGSWYQGPPPLSGVRADVASGTMLATLLRDECALPAEATGREEVVRQMTGEQPSKGPSPGGFSLYVGRVLPVIVAGVLSGVLAAVQLQQTSDRVSVAVAVLVAVLTAALVVLRDVRDLRNLRTERAASNAVAADLVDFIETPLTRVAVYLSSMSGSDTNDGRLEALKTIVLESIVSGFGLSNLRAMILCPRGGRLIPSDHRPGWTGRSSFGSIPLETTRGRALRRLLEDGRSVRQDDANQITDDALAVLKPDDHYRAFARVPIKVGDSYFGILWVDGQDPGSIPEAAHSAFILLAALLGTGMALCDSQTLQMEAPSDSGSKGENG